MCHPLKRLAALTLSLCLLVLPFAPPAKAALPPVTVEAGSAIVVDYHTGQILYGKNIDDRLVPASVSKMLTGLLAVELGDLEETLIASENVEIYGTVIDLQPGEQMTLREALYALMLPSANDVGILIAEHFGGTEEGFAAMLNQRAAELGLQNSHFTNSWGRNDADHYMSTRDMALLTVAAMENETFREFMAAPSYNMAATNLSDTRALQNYHLMLRPDSEYYYPDAIGGKVGWWPVAVYMATTVAERDGRTLVCAVMDTSRYGRFTDTEFLLDYAFAEFTQVTLPAASLDTFTVPLVDNGSEVGNATLAPAGDIALHLPLGVGITDIEISYTTPASVTLQGEETASAYIQIPDDSGEFVSQLTHHYVIKAHTNTQVDEGPPGEPTAVSPYIIWAIAAAVALLLLAAVALFWHKRKKR